MWNGCVAWILIVFDGVEGLRANSTLGFAAVSCLGFDCAKPIISWGAICERLDLCASLRSNGRGQSVGRVTGGMQIHDSVSSLHQGGCADRQGRLSCPFSEDAENVVRLIAEGICQRLLKIILVTWFGRAGSRIQLCALQTSMMINVTKLCAYCPDSVQYCREFSHVLKFSDFVVVFWYELVISFSWQQSSNSLWSRCLRNFSGLSMCWEAPCNFWSYHRHCQPLVWKAW